MPSRISAHIFIGEDFPRLLLPELYEAVSDDGVGSYKDYSGGFVEKEFCTEEDVLRALDVDGVLALMHHEADNGTLPEIETFLQSNYIPYNRYGGSSSGAFMDDVSFFRPGMLDSRSLITDDDGTPIVPASVAVTAYEALLAGNVHAALTVLAPWNGHTVPPLPPFKLVGRRK